jgi:hypothetical protein
MNRAEFLQKLNSCGFAERYYRLCADFPVKPSGGATTKGKKEEVLSLFEASRQPVKYNGKFRMYELILPKVGETEFAASLFFQRHGLEFTFGFKAPDDEYGTNLAVLSSELKKTFDPGFSITPPYPRPDHNGDIESLGKIIEQFSSLVRSTVGEFERNS